MRGRLSLLLCGLLLLAGCHRSTRSDEATSDCRHSESICGTGTTCAANGQCLMDCRENLADACGPGLLCNQGTGACVAAQKLDCNEVPGICWENQVCDAPTGYCREAAIDTALAYDVQLYDYTLHVDTAASTFSGQVSIFLVATRGGTATLTLDVGKTVVVPVEGGTAPYTPYTVTSVKSRSGATLAFTQDSTAGTLTVTLGTPLEANASEVLTVAYQGPLNPISDRKHDLYFTGLMRREGKLGHSLVQTFGWPHHTRRWLPSHDHPRDIARAIARVSIDNGLPVQANGVLVQESEGTPHRRTFLLRQPVPTYALNFIASDYTRVPIGSVEGVQVEAYMYPVAAESAVPPLWWTGTLGAMKYLNEALGPFPFERYAMMQVPSALGGMEHATVVSIADTRTEGPDEEGHGNKLVIHEMLHHWWGDSAHQSSWEEFWLNESLASFYTAEALGVLGGRSAFQAELDRMKAAIFKSPARYDDDALRWSRHPEEVPGETTKASFAAPYVKGPWVWQMIRLQLGESAFAAFMKRFYAATRFKPYSTTQLLALLNAESAVDFTPFFKEWVYGKGWPKLASTWSYDSARRVIRLTVRQTQDVARYGSYTFSGPLALKYVFDDADAATASCTGEVTFTGGALESTVDIPCARAPTTMSQPFTRDLLVELVP
ncbi:M1 family aminopeptidase [Archangium violaceum]|uniref:M1 family metallopeptidase n=1 Tax=Archangium violaceum TaxID=83451 RepID=UPI002B2A0E11|nr:M1 family aminopeptidase [Archangium gephyra]